MPHKCPLCLMELGQSEELVRFCLTHRTPQQFNCVDTPAAIFCPARDGRCNDSPDSGVFLRHIGCEAKNPFWDKTKKLVELPGDDKAHFRNTSTVPHKVSTSKGVSDVEVYHWQIGMLRSVPPDSEEMWFPLMLLRATTEVDQHRRIGVLVELAGAKRVGKTVLAVQAMDSKGYVSNEVNGRSLTLKDYIYSRRPDSIAIAPLIDMFYLRDIMERNHAFDPNALGTRAEPGDLKVVFIEPPKETESDMPHRNGDLSQRLRGFGSEILWQIKDLLGISDQVGATSSGHPYWYTVIFYDTAGELHQRGARVLSRIEEVAEKAAVFVNAVELLDPAHDTSSLDSSITVAKRRLGALRGKKNVECCLIVTQLDVVWSKIAKEDQEKIERIAQAVDFSPTDDREARKVLIKWLRASKDQNIRSLDKLMKGVKVFFVWTVGIPTNESNYKGARTYSYGLARFICWCLGTPWRDITHAESAEPEP